MLPHTQVKGHVGGRGSLSGTSDSVAHGLTDQTLSDRSHDFVVRGCVGCCGTPTASHMASQIGLPWPPTRPLTWPLTDRTLSLTFSKADR